MSLLYNRKILLFVAVFTIVLYIIGRCNKTETITPKLSSDSAQEVLPTPTPTPTQKVYYKANFTDILRNCDQHALQTQQKPVSACLHYLAGKINLKSKCSTLSHILSRIRLPCANFHCTRLSTISRLLERKHDKKVGVGNQVIFVYTT